MPSTRRGRKRKRTNVKEVLTKNKKVKLNSDGVVKLVEPLTPPKSNSLHPLHVEVVLDNVFKMLREEELKNSREVCKSWDNLISPILRRKYLREARYAVFRNDKHIVEFNRFFKDRKSNLIYNHFSLKSDCSYGSSGFLKFFNLFTDHIKGLSISFPMTYTQLTNLLEFQGENLSSLSLNMRNYPSNTSFFKKEPTGQIEPIPKLRHLLSLELIAKDELDEKTLSFLLSNAPSLTKVTLEMNERNFWPLFDFCTIDQIRNLRELRLRKFYCKLEDFQRFIRLGERDLKLKLFECTLEDDEDRRVFKDFLTTQKDELESLKISNAGKLVLPSLMPQLKSLKIYEPDCEEDNGPFVHLFGGPNEGIIALNLNQIPEIGQNFWDHNFVPPFINAHPAPNPPRREPFSPLLYASNFPQLKELDVTPFDHEEEQQIKNFNLRIFPSQPPSLSLVKLTLYDGCLSPSTLGKIAQIFPRLKILNIKEYSECSKSLKTRVLRALWKIKPWQESLEELHIDFGLEQVHFDSIFSGATSTVLKNISLKNKDRGLIKTRPKMLNRYKSNSIKMMKNLKRLKIHLCDQINSAHNFFTDVSGYLIFGQMDLEELYISAFAHKFSRHCTAELKEKIPQFNPFWLYSEEEYYSNTDSDETSSESGDDIDAIVMQIAPD